MCLKAPKVEFLPSLLGGSCHHGTHIRFNTSAASASASEEEDNSENDEPSKTIEEVLEESSELERFHSNSPFNLPTLNPTQQRVVDEFLSAFYIVGGIEYTYKSGDSSVKQKLRLLRREWPSRVNNINADTTKK